jgi:5S rRNA maturation endonuclease (ribonuclease M5)
MDIRDVLENLGYKLRDDGNFWRSKPLYRDSSNPTSLRISKKTGRFLDFSANLKGTFEELVKLTTGAKDLDEVKRYLKEKNVFISKEVEDSPKIEMPETWDISILSRLIKDNSYWNNRGISNETLKEFYGGVAISGRMEGRYVFPTIDKNNKIIGLSGRDITNRKEVKWKHLGKKQSWVFPSHIKREEIEASGEVILVEGIGDVLQLWQCGYRNVLCLFGVHISDKLVTTLCTLKVDKIIIATNNEANNNSIGNKRAVEIYERLSRFCNKNKIQIKLPLKKDFLEMNPDMITDWQSGKVLAIVGSRDFNDYNLLKTIVTPKIKNISTIVSGGARGADTLARNFATEYNLPMVEILPEWNKYGKRAAILRNEDIINNADSVVAFHLKNSPGTANSIQIAKQMGKPIEIIDC